MELSFILAEMLAALRVPGCALCRLHEDRKRRYVSMLLAEQTNDGLTLATFAASRGWCAEHVRTLVQINLQDWGDLRKTAILYEAAWAAIQPVLDDIGQTAAAEQDLHPRETVAAHRQRLFGHRSPEGPARRGDLQPATAGSPATRQLMVGPAAQPCPLCVSMAEYDQLVYRVVASALGHSRLRRAWEAADPICLPHLHALSVHTASGHYQEWLVSDVLQKVRLLEAEVDGYLSRRHRACPPCTDREQEQAVLRLVAWFSGEPATEYGRAFEISDRPGTSSDSNRRTRVDRYSADTGKRDTGLARQPDR